MKSLFLALSLVIPLYGNAQVDTSFIYNPNRPYGALDIRIAKSATRYYYLQEDKTFSYRENPAGVRTNTYRSMTSWDSSPYKEGNLRERNGSSDAFIMNYRLLFPAGYQANYSKGYPMIVMMHGAGERANCWDNDCHWADRSWRPANNQPPAPTSSSHQLLNNDHNLSHGGKPHLDARNLAGTRLPDDPGMPLRAFPGFVLFPQNLNGWDTNTVHDAIRIIRLIIKKYNVDPNRIYVHGLSNGGIATYNVIKRAPWLFAAALPMSSPTEAAIINQGMLEEVAHIPLWTFQGGRDVEPSPSRTEGYVRRFREAGAEVRYSLYANLGHGTWNTAYSEPDFFSWMRSKSKQNIHVFYGNTRICNGEGVRLGLADGFLAYQWQRDGNVVSGATGHEYVATQPGVYRARFSRISRNPSAAQWEEWSPPVTITGSGSEKATIVPLTTTHLRGPDNATENTIRLKSEAKADRYLWYKNGVRINIPNNDLDDTVRILTISGTSTGNNGAYTLRTAGLEGCESEISAPVNLFFNNSAPYLPDSNIPASFRLVSRTASTVNLAWDDGSSVETAFEVWRRKPGEPFVLAGRTGPNTESFTDRGLTPSTTYHYKIRVVNNQGRSRYAPGDDVGTNLVVSTANDTEAPTAPKDLRVVRNTTSSISLAWTGSTDSNGAISHYVVYFGSQSRATNSAATEYTLTGLPINTSYAITVKAVDNAGLLSPASNQITGTTSVSGLWYGHSTGAWTDLDQINIWDQPEFTGWVPNFTLSPRTQDEYFNFEFEGYLYIQEAGNYYFYLNSDEGSRLHINGQQVVDFDGLHGRSSANAGFGVRSPSAIPLSAGPHEIRVRYFEYISGESLSVAYQGPDTDNLRMLIPDEALTSGSATGPSNKPPVIAITNPDPDQQFTAPASISIAVTASDPDGNVQKVEFFNGSTKLGEDTTSPYTFSWSNVAAGSYTITARATDNNNAVASASVNVFVTSGQGCAGSGRITHEVWTGISGTAIESIPQGETPDNSGEITIFEAPQNIGDNYGTRIRGYICPPASGTYVFWISGNDNSELWLSTDENPTNKRRIAYANGYTNVRQWDKYASQRSEPVNLAANQRYYVEALHKEGVGTDHVAVGWQLPGGTLERPIPGVRLIPFGASPGGTAPVVQITNPDDGESFQAPASIAITASASISDGAVQKVEFYNGTVKLGEDNSSPYSFSWSNVQAGSYTITAKAIANSGESSSVSVAVTVSSGSACVGNGSILRELWTGIQYNEVSYIPVESPPDGVSELTIFEEPSNAGDNYGTRVRGYLCAPATGSYTFWIASNDHSELWLSTDSDPANKRRIAFVDSYTNARQWNKFPSQQSSPITLVSGQRYYIEALHKEGVGTDHMAVGWQLPNGIQERPIPGNRLSPFENGTFAARVATAMSEDLDEDMTDHITVFPNPATSELEELTLSGFEQRPGGLTSVVEIRRVTGELIHSRAFTCETGCGSLSVPVSGVLGPGVYIVNITANGRRTTRRLIVK